MRKETQRSAVAAALAGAGCVAPDEEADELLAAAGGDAGRVAELVARRTTGEPLAWIIGTVRFAGQRIAVHSGVYVPRPHTQVLAERAAALLPELGTAIDLCTGSGAVAAALGAAHPRARILATDVDPAAVACARGNGVDARLGDLDEPVPPELAGQVDVITAVVPYVPSGAVALLARDVVAFEPHPALDGGPDGTAFLRLVVERSPRWLTSGGWLLLELGGDQAARVGAAMRRAGFLDVAVGRDEDGDDRMIEGRWPG